MVASLRAQYDPAARLGMPAHITLMFPFVPRQELNALALGRLQDIANCFSAFDFSLASVGRFPRTAYLEPHPASVFIELTQAVFQVFAPDRLCAQSGVHAIVPHVTAANGNAQHAELAQAALQSALLQGGPIRASCRSMTVFENELGRWQPLHTVALARNEVPASAGCTP